MHRPLSSEGLRQMVPCLYVHMLLAQTSELGGVTTQDGLRKRHERLAQTSELGGVTTINYFHNSISFGLHRPLSSEGLRPHRRKFRTIDLLLHRPLSSEGLRLAQLLHEGEIPLHRPLSSEGLRQRLESPNIFQFLAQTSELGGVTTVFESQCRTHVLHRPLSSEGLRLLQKMNIHKHFLHRPLSSEGLRQISTTIYSLSNSCTDL